MKRIMMVLALLASVVGIHADSTTTRFGITKPSIGTTGWGTKTNTNWDTIDDAAGQSIANTYTSTNIFTGAPFKITGTGNPSDTGLGLEFNGGASPYIQSINRGSSAFLPFTFSALNYDWQIGGVSKATMDNSGNLRLKGPNPYADIVSYGAISGDGLSDVSAINSALSAASSIAFAPCGTYTIVADTSTSQFIDVLAGKKLVGAGPCTVLQVTGNVANSGSPYFVRLDGADAGIFNLTVDVNGSSVTFQAGTGVTNYGGIMMGGTALQSMNPAVRGEIGNVTVKNCVRRTPADGFDRVCLGIDMFNTPYANVHDVDFYNSDIGLFMSTDFSTTTSRYRVNNITGSSMTFPTIYWEFGDGDVVNNVTIDASTGSPNAGVFFLDVKNGQMSNVTSHGGQFWSRSTDKNYLRNMSFSNISISSVPSAGSVTGYGMDLYRLLNSSFNNVTVSSCASHGIHLSGTARLTNVSSSSNTANGFLFDQTGSFDITNSAAEYNGQHGVQISPGPEAVSFTGFVARNNSRSSSGTYDGLRVNTSSVTVVGGRFYDNQTSATQHYGIFEQVTTATNTYMGFSGYGNTTALISVGSTKSVAVYNNASGLKVVSGSGMNVDNTLTAGTFSGSGASLTSISGSSISGGTFGAVNGSALTNLSGSAVSGGTFGAVNGSALTNLSGSAVSGGTFGAVNGSALTSLTAANVSGSHTLPDSVLSTNVPLLNANNTFAGQNIFTSGPVQFTGTGNPTGTGIGVEFNGGATPYMQAIDRNASAYLPLQFTGSAFTFSPSGTPKVTITNGGSVGISTTAPTAQLTTTGSVRFANFGAGAATFDANGNISSASDARLKDVQGDFTRGLSDILKIHPKNYKWKPSTGYDTAHVYSGFIAQDVLGAIPEAVMQNKDGFYSFQDRPIEAALVNAVKELSKKLDEMAARISALEKAR